MTELPHRSPEDTAPADPATPLLRVPARRVSRNAKKFWALRAAAGWLVLIIVQIVLALLFAPLSWLWITAIISLLLGAAHSIGMPLWRYRVHQWEASPEAVYTRAGWFDQETRIAPISRIQTVDSHRGPLEQLFGLANVTVTTASAAGPLRINGLDRDVAERLVADLTERTRSETGDAT